MSRPVIAFLTDFGTHDHYVGVMKGVALGICPEAALVDITHEIPPQDVMAASLQLAAAYSYFPAHTVFVVVVDPGVGTSRRALAVEIGGYRFVAPDNGVLTTVLEDASRADVVELTSKQHTRATVSRTFEGRDRFAPVAAWLANGATLADVGAPVAHDDVVRLYLPRASATSGRIDGVVIHVDRFGNLITNITRQLFDEQGGSPQATLDVAGSRIDAVSTTYGDVPAGALCALFGSSEYLEIAVRGGSASRQLQSGRGTAVRVNIDRL
ncbi:MAG TPA: SAM-dependent chlorinase/fluorinase [Vicinamibacterales bacterium]|nr:SAM-dependent chlorinase/fluorinase [Vicinamibacterales bacterium]